MAQVPANGDAEGLDLDAFRQRRELADELKKLKTLSAKQQGPGNVRKASFVLKFGVLPPISSNQEDPPSGLSEQLAESSDQPAGDKASLEEPKEEEETDTQVSPNGRSEQLAESSDQPAGDEASPEEPKDVLERPQTSMEGDFKCPNCENEDEDTGVRLTSCGCDMCSECFHRCILDADNGLPKCPRCDSVISEQLTWKTTWSCQNCANKEIVDQSQCSNCEAPRPDKTKRPVTCMKSNFECPICENEGEHTGVRLTSCGCDMCIDCLHRCILKADDGLPKCLSCDAAISEQLTQEVTWSCPNCMNEENVRQAHCSKCEAQRPDQPYLEWPLSFTIGDFECPICENEDEDTGVRLMSCGCNMCRDCLNRCVLDAKDGLPKCPSCDAAISEEVMWKGKGDTTGGCG